MRYFSLLNLEHILIYLFPTSVFILIFAAALGYRHFQGKDDTRRNRIAYRYPEGIEDRNGPFPLAMALIIAGTVIWVLAYILGYGLFGVVI